jgi:hypothetical protein
VTTPPGSVHSVSSTAAFDPLSEEEEPVGADPTRHERAARDQALFREVNEHLVDVMNASSMFHEFVCECASPDCAESIPLDARVARCAS